jgi:Putative prokaryotic signal transducing protein
MAHDDQSKPDELVEVLRSSDPMRVRIAFDLLQGAGIEAFIFDPQGSRLLGSTIAIQARLMVYGDRADEARDRLKELGFEE